jgi:hypothetical protein
MTIAVKARYDGSVIIPDRPLDLPRNEVIEVEIRSPESAKPSQREIERRRALHRKVSGRIVGPTIPDEALSRENLYEDRI